MKDLVVLRRQDLEQMLKEAAEKAAEASKTQRKEIMNTDEAVEYLNELGYPIPKSTLYQHTMKGTIPVRRFGKRKLMFVARELEEWASNQISGKNIIEKRKG